MRANHIFPECPRLAPGCDNPRQALADWARALKISPGALRGRVERHGWAIAIQMGGRQRGSRESRPHYGRKIERPATELDRLWDKFTRAPVPHG